MGEKYQQYRLARRFLHSEIRRAKARAWSDLLSMVEEDPWGLPYKLVMGRLRPASPGFSATLQAGTLERLVDSLFPPGITHNPSRLWPDFVWDDTQAISVEETLSILKNTCNKKKNPAPGPDGVGLLVWRRVPRSMIECLTISFNCCLREGHFPLEWKGALLVLTPKNSGRSEPPAELPKARPICLLNEVGKILERILVQRMLDWMESHPESGLSRDQFGFRIGRSTNDALSLVSESIRTSTESGGYTVAVGLDIQNAFNSIPWTAIRCALREKGFPAYIQRIIDSYLHARSIEFSAAGGKRLSHPMTSGVPQGSVLGPLLWNIAFDGIPGSDVIQGCRVICYADDTLILASAAGPGEAATLASLQARLVLKRT